MRYDSLEYKGSNWTNDQGPGEEGSDEWEVIRLPAILPSNTPVWPEYWKIEELEKTKASIPVANWNAQYQQEPTAEEGAIIKETGGKTGNTKIHQQ